MRKATPLALLLALWAVFGCGCGTGGGGGEASTSPHFISGRVTLNGEGFPGATVFLDGPSSRVSSTDSSGGFTFTGLSDGAYTVSPAVDGQRLTPSARAVALSGASVEAADFVLVTYELSGSIVQGGHGCPGATVRLRQGGSPDRIVTTSWGGDYSFSGLLSGSYSIEAAVDGQAVSPGFTNPVTVDDASRSGFDWLVDTHDITGRVELAGGAWTGGGMAILTGDAVLVAELDGSGAYAFRDLPNGSYSVRVYVPGQAVTPASRDVVVAGEDQTASALSLAAHSLSGRVIADQEGGAGRAGVTLTLGGPVSATAVTGIDGEYSFGGLINGTYSVTPALPGATFAPAIRSSLVVLDSDSPGNDFALFYVPPGAATGGADAVTASGATLRGTVGPNGSAAAAWFEWGTDPSLAWWSETAQVPAGSGTASVPVLVSLDYLSAGTVYYYRAVARGRGGTVRGAVESFTTDPPDRATVVVNSLADVASPPEGTVTLRAAIEQVAPGGKILFDPSLDGGTIELGLVASDHSVLKGETFVGMQFQEFAERDYGRSALYAAKDLTIDASALPGGITLRWAGGDANRARVLAVYGNLTMKNVTVTGGHSSSEAITGGTQAWTLARGGGVAVWGVATLEHCTLASNKVSGDENASRDRGAFGGGLYANTALLADCVVSGNAAIGFGAAGGGVYSVGGAADSYQESSLTRCAVTGNRVTGQHAYGGGVYSDGGGPGNLMHLYLTNCTIARNQVEDHPVIPQNPMYQYYYRGGGAYMSNGYLVLTNCTIAENAVTGPATTFGTSGKPNMGGGGLAATIGNAHVVEHMELRGTVVVGNTVNGASSDVYTGSLLHFYSFGYNLLGTIDFSQMLVPIPAWACLDRRHWPKVGDRDRIETSAVLDVDAAVRSNSIRSEGTDAGQAVVLWYPPKGGALDRIPTQDYEISSLMAGYEVAPDGADDFLVRILDRLSTDYAGLLGSDFGANFRSAFEAKLGQPLDSVVWSGSAGTWPSEPQNASWITFWRDLDTALGDRLGAVRLGDDFWGTFTSGPLGESLTMIVEPGTFGPFGLVGSDQLGRPRPWGARGDVGAVEAEGGP